MSVPTCPPPTPQVPARHPLCSKLYPFHYHPVEQLSDNPLIKQHCLLEFKFYFTKREIKKTDRQLY